MNRSLYLLVLCTGTCAHAQQSSASYSTNDGLQVDDKESFPSVFFDEPTKDTFTYPNIGSSGNTRLNGWSTYYPGVGRQSSMVCMFDTQSMGVPSGNEGYVKVISMEFTAVTYASGPTALYDDTRDPPENSLWAGGPINVFDAPGGFSVIGTVDVPADPNAIIPASNEANNAPVELFGARYNNEHSASSWDESASGTPAYQNGQENIIPIDFDSDGTQRDVIDNIASLPLEYTSGIFISQHGFDVPAGDKYFTDYPTGGFLDRPYPTFEGIPFAIGKSFHIPDGTPGHSIFGNGQSTLELNDPIPQAYRLRFDVNVQSPWVQQYMQESIQDGWITLVYSHLAFGDHSGGNFTYWMTKEGSHKLPPSIDVNPSTLRFEYMHIPFGDLNRSGTLEYRDVLLLISNLQATQLESVDHDLSDVNRDGRVNFFDVLDLIHLVHTGT